jgi:hypothetical protein
VDVAVRTARDGRGKQLTVRLHTRDVADEDPPICPACGVTMVPSILSARVRHDSGWVCLECEEIGEPLDG